MELAPNNNKEWFDENRKRYEQNVKKAFELFITSLIEEIKKHDSSIEITYKDAIFRINRDIRFSKDKAPYKLNRSAIISPKGKKDKAFPGLYIEMGPEFFRIYGGVYQPDKEQLYSIREKIAENPLAIEKLINDEEFVQLFGVIRGEKNKIIGKEFKEIGQENPIIYNKQFYWFAEFEPRTILRDDLLEITMHAYQVSQNLTTYFAKAMQLK
jgi:uncharacterized protein (TIGR02453 family)